MQNPCVAEKCAKPAGLRRLSYFKWLILGLLLLLLLLLRGCSFNGINGIKAPSITSPMQGAVEAGTIHLTGTAASNSTIEILQNGEGVGNTTVDAEGNWTIDRSLSEPGDYEFIAQAIDADGKAAASSEKLSLIIPAPIIAAVTPMISLPATGDVQAGAIAFSGKGTPDSEIELLQDDKRLEKVTVDSEGNWVHNVTLSEVGTYHFVAQTLAADSATDGNEVLASSKHTLTIAPQIITPVIGSPDSGEVEAGMVELTGTAAPNSTVELLQNDKAISKVSVDSDGNWKNSVELAASGNYRFITNAISDSGEVTASSNAISLTIPAAVVAIIPPVISSPSNGDVEPATFNISGTANSDSTLELLRNNSVIAKVEVNSEGHWQTETALTDVGEYTYMTQTIASEGNEGREVMQSNRLVLTIVSQDQDADGVSDKNDLCPNTATGVTVDKLGCIETKSIVLKGVNFETNSAQLTRKSLSILDKVVGSLSNVKGMKLDISGHTDSDGNKDNNLRLSHRRAEVVLGYLRKHGVDTSGMSAKGYGESKPIAKNSTAEDKAKNRRVELNRK